MFGASRHFRFHVERSPGLGNFCLSQTRRGCQPCQRGAFRLDALIDRPARRVADNGFGAGEAETVDEAADIIGIEPGRAAVRRAAGGAFRVSRRKTVAPAADPSDLLVDEPDAFKLDVLLRI